jgi:hypothetical protein
MLFLLRSLYLTRDHNILEAFAVTPIFLSSSTIIFSKDWLKSCKEMPLLIII